MTHSNGLFRLLSQSIRSLSYIPPSDPVNVQAPFESRESSGDMGGENKRARGRLSLIREIIHARQMMLTEAPHSVAKYSTAAKTNE